MKYGLFANMERVTTVLRSRVCAIVCDGSSKVSDDVVIGLQTLCSVACTRKPENILSPVVLALVFRVYTYELGMCSIGKCVNVCGLVAR